jgi:hypothetical protein
LEKETKQQEKELKIVKMLLEQKKKKEQLKRKQSASKRSKRQSSRKKGKRKGSSHKLRPIRNYANSILQDYIMDPQTKKMFTKKTDGKGLYNLKSR